MTCRSNFQRYFSFILAGLFLLSCESDPEAELPTYLGVPGIDFRQSNGASSTSHGITEVWVYADSLLVGAFHPPVEIPLLINGSATIEMFAGIRKNGIAADLAIYPFYDRFVLSLDDGVGQEVRASFSYDPKVVFPWSESFEANHQLTMDLDGDEETFFVTSTSDALEGRSATAMVTPEHPALEVESRLQLFELPADGRPFFLEFDYWSDTDLQVGFRNGPDAFYLVQLFPNDSWEKMYVDFTQTLGAMPGSDYQVRFRAQHDGSSTLPQQIRLDNLRLVHFGL